MPLQLTDEHWALRDATIWTIGGSSDEVTLHLQADANGYDGG